MIRLLLLTAAVTLMPVSAENWPCFRGPGRQGISAGKDFPVKWAAADAKWKTAIPGDGWSSPIVWDDRIFLTSTTNGGVSCHVLSLDAPTGRLLWDVEVFKQDISRKEQRNSYATPTPVTDGRAVYAVFGSGAIAAVDFDGKPLWTFREAAFYSRHGLGASPVLEDGRLILPWDWSQNPKDGEERVGWQIPWEKSFVFALDASSGKPAWKTMRGPSRIAHVTPNIFTDASGRRQVVSGAGDVLQGFDLKDGKLLWTAGNKGEGVVPSIVIGGGMAFAANGFGGFESIRAFRLEGASGDITATHLAWEQAKNSPKLPSLTFVAPHLFVVTEGGIGLCLDAGSGEVVWRERLDGTFAASPVVADGRLYAVADNGDTVVIEAGPAFKILARNPLGERVQASPAFSEGRILIRGEKHLFCFGR